MAGTRGKNKGNAGELRIAKFLTSLYEQKFIRVPSSGAYVGGKNAARKTEMDATQISYFKSDLIPPSNMRKLVIESKFYQDFPWHQLMCSGDVKLLDSWIQQTLDVVDPSDLWFVVFRINHRGSYACFDTQWASEFAIDNHVRYKNYVVTEFEQFFQNNKQRIAQLSYTEGT
jgi:hypothetical protein